MYTPEQAAELAREHGALIYAWKADSLSTSPKQLAAMLNAAQPKPQSEPVVTIQMVDAYLKANDAYWRETDALPVSQQNPSRWRQGTPSEATRVSLEAALALYTAPPDHTELLREALDVIKSECGYGGTNTYDPRAICDRITKALGESA